MIEPDRVGDDATGETMPFESGGKNVGFHPKSLHRKQRPNNLTVSHRLSAISYRHARADAFSLWDGMANELAA